MSAILLDDDYYNFLKQGKVVVDGVTVLDAAYLIPFKAKAWIDLTNCKAAGEHIDSKNVNYLILAFAKGEASSFFLSLDSFSSLLCRLLTTESDALSTGVLVRSTQVQVIFPKPARRIVFALFTSRSSL